jgi:MFS transporter, DHA2 family, methylenomycin A resistance protein
MTTISLPRAASRHATDPKARRRFFGITIGLLLVNFDATVLNVALPRIGADLHSSPAALPWTADAYTVVVSGLLLAAGALADRLGSRRVFRGALITFAAVSVLCALAPNAGTLIAGRALLGVSAAGLMPASLALLRVLYPDPVRRVRAVGSWAAVTTLGLSAGPALGGVLLAIDSPDAWRLIFLVNPPFALLGFVLIRGIGEPERGPRHAVDVAGLLMSILGLGAATFGLIESGSAGWTSPAVLAAAAVGLRRRRADVLARRRPGRPGGHVRDLGRGARAVRGDRPRRAVRLAAGRFGARRRRGQRGRCDESARHGRSPARRRRAGARPRRVRREV